MIADRGSRGVSRLARLTLASVFALCALGGLSAGAQAAVPYQFNEPTVRAIGDEEVIFDAFDEETGQLKDQCSNDPTLGQDSDIPNTPARAYRSADQIVLFSSHFTTRRFIGPSFTQLSHPCDEIVMESGDAVDPSAFDDQESINSLWTTNGTKVYGLVSEEHQGWRHEPTPLNCAGDYWEKCWRNSVTLATSTDGGATFTSSGCPPPGGPCGSLVAGSPYQFNSETPAGPYGYFNPSNLVGVHPDGYLYALVRSLGTSLTPAQEDGTCLIRTANTDAALADATSWQAWNGTGFEPLFVDPYPDEPGDKAAHVCKPVDADIESMSGSLTYSKYFEKYVLVDRLGGAHTPGVYFATSDDLINWSKPTLLMKAEVPPYSGEPDCVAPHPVRTPSLIDPTSGRTNFDTIGRTPYLYYTRAIMEYDDQNRCVLGLNRDLVRVKIEFTTTALPPSNPPLSVPGDGGVIDNEPAAATKAAKVTITSAKKQDVDKLAITIRLDEDAMVEVTGSVNVPGASKIYSFKRVRKQVAANKRVKLKLKLASKNLKKVKRALRRGKKLTAKVKVTATDTDGNNAAKRSSIKLKP